MPSSGDLTHSRADYERTRCQRALEKLLVMPFMPSCDGWWPDHACTHRALTVRTLSSYPTFPTQCSPTGLSLNPCEWCNHAFPSSDFDKCHSWLSHHSALRTSYALYTYVSDRASLSWTAVEAFRYRAAVSPPRWRKLPAVFLVSRPISCCGGII